MARRRLRILHALGTLNPGGVETWLLNILKCMDRDRLQFDFCTFGPQPGLFDTQVERLGARILRFQKSRNPWSFASGFRRLLREGNYNVVHSHVYLFSGALLRWAQAEGIPIRIAHSHRSRDDRPGTPARRCYRRVMKSWIRRHATHGLAASRPAAALFGEDWEADSRFRVLYYGIDASSFHVPIDRDQLRIELGVPVDAPVVGHVGRFVPPKNHRIVLEIAGEILKRRPEVHFLLVGDGPLRPEIEAKARAMGLSANIHFAGTRIDVPRLLCGGMDAFVFPSLQEGFGLSVLEAQAVGLSCVVSDAVPQDVVLSRESVKFLQLSAPVSDWAAEVIRGLDAPRPQLAFALDNVAQSRFSIQQSVRELTSIYAMVPRSTAPITGKRYE